MTKKFQRFFNASFCGPNCQTPDYNLLTLISEGLKPRFFSAEMEDDKMIYTEDMEIEEMYFIMSGKIGIGFQLPNYVQN